MLFAARSEALRGRQVRGRWFILRGAKAIFGALWWNRVIATTVEGSGQRLRLFQPEEVDFRGCIWRLEKMKASRGQTGGHDVGRVLAFAVFGAGKSFDWPMRRRD